MNTSTMSALSTATETGSDAQGIKIVDYSTVVGQSMGIKSFETPQGSLDASPAQIVSKADGATAQVVTVTERDGRPVVDVSPELPKAQAEQVVAQEQADPSTIAVSVNHEMSVTGWTSSPSSNPFSFPIMLSNDPQRASQQTMYDMPPNGVFRNAASWRALEYPWTISRGAGVTVAVIDTGVDGSHPDLAGQVLPGFDFTHDTGYQSFTPGWQADHPHGTHVAGIIAAKAGNGVGIAGIAPEVKILPVKVLDSTGAGSSADVARGVIAAVDAGAQIINMSLGSPDPDAALEAAIAYAVSHHVVVVAAGGNIGMPGYITLNGWSYPASYPGVIGVASADSDCGGVGGTHIDISAGGCNVLSTIPGTGYARYSGTSMATPQVAGEAALLLGAGTPPFQVEPAIEGTTFRMGSILAMDCVEDPTSTPTNRSYTCTPNGTDEVSTHLMYGAGTISIPGTLAQARAMTYTSGNYFGATAAATPTPTLPAPAPAGGGGGGSTSTSSTGSTAGSGSGGGGGGSLHEITSVRPATGPLSGGNTIAIVGYGFTGAREVRIGDKVAQFTLINDAHIEVMLPAGEKIGAADVSVVLPPAVGRAFAPGGYVYTANQAADTTTPAPSSGGGGNDVSIPEKPFAPVTGSPKVTVSGPQVVITAPTGATSTIVQKKTGARWTTVRRITNANVSATVTLTKGQYRVVSALSGGQRSTKTFTVR